MKCCNIGAQIYILSCGWDTLFPKPRPQHFPRIGHTFFPRLGKYYPPKKNWGKKLNYPNITLMIITWSIFDRYLGCYIFSQKLFMKILGCCIFGKILCPFLCEKFRSHSSGKYCVPSLGQVDLISIFVHFIAPMSLPNIRTLKKTIHRSDKK